MKLTSPRPFALLATVALQAAATAAPLQITPSGGYYNSFGPSISDDGSRVVFYSASDPTGQNTDHNFEVYLYERADGSLRQVTNDTRGIVAGSQLPTISGDGSRIVFQSFETRGSTGFFRSQYFDVASGQTTALNDYTAQFQITDIGRDGRFIGLNRDNDGLRVIDTATGIAGPVLAFNPSGFTMSGDGRHVATGSFNGSVTLIDTANGQTIAIGPGTGLQFSEDGSTLAFSSTFDPLGTNADHNQELFVYDLATGHYRQITNTLGGSSSEASLSADGRRVAFTSTADILGDNADGNQEIFVFDLLDGTFAQITHTAGALQYSFNAALSGDGSTLAYVSTGDLTGGNTNHIPQVFLESLAPRLNQVPEPSTPLLAAVALALLVRRGRRPQR